MTEWTVPVLPSRDLEETLGFWGRLGFASRVTEPRDTDYGIREFAVVDRSGNLVRVGSPISA